MSSASLAPIGTPAPLPAASASPAALGPGWSYTGDGWFSAVRFAPDGGVVTVEISTSVQAVGVRRLASDGSTISGWPWHQANADTADAALGPSGSTYVITRSPSDLISDWRLHRLDGYGAEMAGFPVRLPAVEVCRIAVATDGAAITACSGQDDTTGDRTTTLTRISPNGHVAAGWPMRIRGEASPLGFEPNGDVVLSINDHVTSQNANFVRVDLVQPDGERDRTWVSTRFSDMSTPILSAAGRMVVVSHAYQDGECGAAISTTYRVLDAHGRTSAGWPVTIRGWGSNPVIRSDGSLVIATGADRVVAWSAGGRTLAGWATSVVDTHKGCYTGSTPVATAGGGVVVIGEKHVTMLDGRGTAVPGWPAILIDRVALTCEGCTPGPSGQVSAVVTASGVYVPVYRGPTGEGGVPGVGVYDLAGGSSSAWDGLVGPAGDEITSLQVAPDGRVWAVVHHRTDVGPVDALVLVGE